ncbi:nucleolar protein 8 [Selaginella moellendorffii]|nr:nucleolar protein 8 [Selaginella moellendorffii]|eukprot:XP_002967525.2 nucleolar protein 8 [Selaginella moellendorffii]
MGQMGEEVRLFVGGLGASVAAQDLERAFGSLGAVRAVEMIRSGDRDFAYIDFVASSPAALRKVFSTYKGCKWKGGCLRVELAKEHYLQRLEREWAAGREDQKKDGEQKERPKMPIVPATRALKIFFPRSRKVKVVSGGKHKRSFERCASHPLALLGLCSCGEHQDQEATDPFEFEHSGYLRLVEKLESKRLDENGSSREVEAAGSNLGSSSIAETSNSERKKKEKQKGDPSSKLPRETKKGKQIEVKRMEGDVNAFVPDEDDLLREKNKKEDKTSGVKASNSKEEKNITSDKEDNDKVLMENESEEEELDEEDGVVLPGLIKKRKAKVETNDTKWDTLFEAAAGLRENEELSEDSFEEQDVEEELEHIQVDQNSSGKVDGSSHETKKINRVRWSSRDTKSATSSKKVLTREECDEEGLDEEGGMLKERRKTEANATKGDNLFGTGVSEALEDEQVTIPDAKKHKSGDRAARHSNKKSRSDKADGSSKEALEGSENGPERKDDQVDRKQQQEKQKDQSWVRFSSWKSLVGDGSGATFSLSTIAGAEPQESNSSASLVPNIKKKGDNSDDQRAKVTTGTSLPVSTSKSTSNDVTESSQHQQLRPSVKALLEKKTCSFMRSPAAEEEWLASKDKLSLDYKAKHRTAVRIKRKSF